MEQARQTYTLPVIVYIGKYDYSVTEMFPAFEENNKKAASG